ncbi:MAG: carboxypeptidase-like regulatory domain-containing protein [Lewinellaceae bacterium]|nr:carboxypeptidase-like regulatory domain-containing protein [Lewinellaceae bacterium]
MKKIYQTYLSLLLPMFCASVLWGQNSTVSGTITSGSTGEKLPGVTVVVKGTTNGTFTDVDGVYTLQASPQDILAVSYTGFVSVETPINGRTRVDILLEEKISELGEIVVVGYGSQKKKVVTGAIATVSEKDIASTPVLRVEQALKAARPGCR